MFRIWNLPLKEVNYGFFKQETVKEQQKLLPDDALGDAVHRRPVLGHGILHSFGVSRLRVPALFVLREAQVDADLRADLLTEFDDRAAEMDGRQAVTDRGRDEEQEFHVMTRAEVLELRDQWL